MKNPPEKALSARESLRRRFHGGYAPGRDCFALLDVLRITCDDDPTAALKGLGIFHGLQNCRLTPKEGTGFLPYGRASWFRGSASAGRLCVESDRQAFWLAPYRVTIYADDRTGLLVDQVLEILELMPSARMIMIELALDFPLTSPVSRDFVRQHGLFGKSRKDSSVPNPTVDRWGARRAQKRLKSYTKHEVAAHRVELVLKRQFLQVCGVRDIFDFRRFVELVPEKHIFFAQLSGERLVDRLRRNLHYSTKDTREILRNVRQRENDLCEVLDYLRRDVGLQNVRRLIVPLPENDLVRRALQDWAAMWPRRRRKLETREAGDRRKPAGPSR
jgi:hypothetical protein